MHKLSKQLLVKQKKRKSELRLLNYTKKFKELIIINVNIYHSMNNISQKIIN